jgi:hypothetical protein
MYSLFTTSHMTKPVQSFVLTSLARPFVGMNAIRSRANRERSLGLITGTSGTGNSDYT